MLKLNQLVLAFELQVADDTQFVVVANTPFYLTPPKDYMVMIAPDLAEMGIHQLKDERVKFPGDIKAIVMVVTDVNFRQFRLVKANDKNIGVVDESITRFIETKAKEMSERIKAAILKAPVDSQMFKTLFLLAAPDLQESIKSLSVLLKWYMGELEIDLRLLFKEIWVAVADEVPPLPKNQPPVVNDEE